MDQLNDAKTDATSIFLGHGAGIADDGTNYNTAIGKYALHSNTTGLSNTANGYQALYYNTQGQLNTANGYRSLYYNTAGSQNTANGYQALYYNTTGNYNTAVCHLAGPNTFNLINTTALGRGATTNAYNQVRIGNSSVTSIGGRYKRNVKENVSGIDFIMGLRPVTYNFDVNAIVEKLGEDIRIDENGNKTKAVPSAQITEAREKKSNKRQIGFIAQEVEELVNNLGVDFSGVEAPENEHSLYSLRYSKFVVLLVKAVQEQQIEIKEQLAMIEELRKEIQELKNRK